MIIGAASEFWRVRITRLDTTEGLDFEWHDDILYREPTVDPGSEVQTWQVQAVALDGSERVVRLDAFFDRASAEDFLAEVEDDLREMTNTQFEDAYIEPSLAEDAEGADEGSYAGTD